MITLNIIFPYDISDISAARNRICSYINILKYKYNINVITFSYNKEIPNIKNVNFYMINPIRITKKNFLKRAIQEILISYKLIKYSQKFQADYTLITIPSMFLLPLGLLLKNKKIVDVRDIQWEYLSNGLIKRILKKIMMYAIRKYNNVIVTNNFEYKYFEKYGIKSLIIYNGIEERKFNKIISLNYSMNKEVTYVGNIGIAQNVMTLVKVGEELPDIKFNIIGDGVDFEKIKNYIEKNNIKNVNLTGSLKWDEILTYYKKSKILFAQLKEEFKSAVPSKLYEYASTGLPIIYGGTGEAVNFINKLENSYVFKSGDYETCKKYIMQLINQNLKISLKNRNYIKNNFIREKNAQKIINILENKE